MFNSLISGLVGSFVAASIVVGCTGEPGVSGPAGPAGPAGPEGKAADTSVDQCPLQAEKASEVKRLSAKGSTLCVYRPMENGAPVKNTWWEAVKQCQDSGYLGLCSYQSLMRACMRGYDLSNTGDSFLADRTGDDVALATNVLTTIDSCSNFEGGPVPTGANFAFFCCAEYPAYP